MTAIRGPTRRCKMDKRVLLIFAFVHIFVAVNSLHCYQCTNCPTVTSSQLVQCDAATTSTPAPSTTTSTPTNNSTPSTNNLTSNPANNSTSSTNNSTSNPTNNSTSSTNNSTSNPTNNSTSSTNNSTANAANKTYVPQLQHDRKKREVSLERNIFYDSEDMRATDDYFCFEMTKQINGTDVVDRGCGMRTSSAICIVSDDLKSLKACKTDKCNGAFNKQLPFFTTIIMLSLSFAIG